jgi:hypothetical protein
MSAEISLCCLLWAVPGHEAEMSAYEDDVLSLIPEHGAAVLSRAVGDGADGAPHEVQLYRFPGRGALDAYLADPRRIALAGIRDDVVARTELFPVTVR